MDPREPGESARESKSPPAKPVFQVAALDPLRYGGHSYDPFDAPGMVVDRIPLGARVLDVGCGTGSIAELIKTRRHAEVVGIEPDPDRAQSARERGLEVVTGELTADLKGKLGEFDVIAFFDVLEHLPVPESLIQSAKPLLKPNGIFLATVPNVAHWTVRFNLLRGRFDYGATGIMDATHLRWFTRKTLLSFIEGAGCNVIDIDFAPGLWMRGYRRLPGLLRRPVVRALTTLSPNAFSAQFVAIFRPS